MHPLTVALTVFLLCPAQAPLADRAQLVVQALSDPDRLSEADLSDKMRQVLGVARLRAVLASLRDQFGTVESYAQIEQMGQYAGRFQLRTSKGFLMVMTLSVENRPPHRISGLFFGPPTPAVSSLNEVRERLAQLPGSASALIRRLDPDPGTLLALNPDEQLAIGSSFKLYVLGTLTQLADPWATVVRLQERFKSLPSGVMQDWPDGSPVTVHTLAVQMISISDNTATDHLIHWIGRRRIEAALAELGHSNPARTIPFLTTREMFALKADSQRLSRYVAADLQQRRELLAELDTVRKPSAYAVPGTPTAIDQVEWFASCADLCRLMDYFRRLGDQRVLAILAVNPGLPGIQRQYRYVGYKGGSEAGVLNMTWLLQSRSGTWYAASFTWNNPEREVDLVKLSGLAQAALDLIARSSAAETDTNDDPASP